MARRFLLCVAFAAVSGMLLLGGCGGTDRVKLALADNPVPRTEESVAAGLLVFEQYCIACHGADATGSGIAGQNLPTHPADLTKVRAPEGVLAMRIKYGVGEVMPVWSEVLDQTQIWSVVNYIKSLENISAADRKRWWN